MDELLKLRETLPVRAVKALDSTTAGRIIGTAIAIAIVLFATNGVFHYASTPVQVKGDNNVVNVQLPSDPVQIGPLTVCEKAQDVQWFMGMGGYYIKALWVDGDGRASVRWDRDQNGGQYFTVALNNATIQQEADQPTLACLQRRAVRGAGSLDP